MIWAVLRFQTNWQLLEVCSKGGPLLVQITAHFTHLGLILATIFWETLIQILPKMPQATQRASQTFILKDFTPIQNRFSSILVPLCHPKPMCMHSKHCLNLSLAWYSEGIRTHNQRQYFNANKRYMSCTTIAKYQRMPRFSHSHTNKQVKPCRHGGGVSRSHSITRDRSVDSKAPKKKLKLQLLAQNNNKQNW